jgi:hypothetical protein
MAAENDKAATTGLTTLRGAQGPECDWTTAVLREPALKLALGGVVGQTAQVEDLGALAEEGANVAAGVERTSENIRVATGVCLRRTGLLAERTKAASQSKGLLKSATRRGRSESLEVEGKATSDLARRTNLLDLESSTDGRQTRRAEGQSLGVVGLESLVLGTETKQDRVLHVRGQNNALVAGLARHLDTKVPGSQSDEGKLGSSTGTSVLVHEVLAGIGIEGSDSITVATGLLNMLPGQSGERRAQRGNGSVCRADQNRLVV